MNFIFARLAAEANDGFSLKKPYPGWIASTLDSLAIDIIFFMFR